MPRNKVGKFNFALHLGGRILLAKILIIEDESSIADNIRFALEQEGFKTVWCSTAAAGSQEIGKGKVDLIVLDVGLPDQDGFSFCRNLRKTHGTPVIFLTARSDEIDKVVGLEIGADDYMVKPFSPRELAARAKAILRRAPLATPGVSQAPFEINEAKYQIHYFGKNLNLSPYEFRLLKVLLERPGRVLSREQLLQLAWEEPEASMDRTVDAHIKSIRSKLKAINEVNDPILTHRGLGYSLKE